MGGIQIKGFVIDPPSKFLARFLEPVSAGTVGST
jgi:hypothetical protein